jgi:hypothetical protein
MSFRVAQSGLVGSATQSRADSGTRLMAAGCNFIPGAALWIIWSLIFEHGDQDRKQTVSNTAQGSPV